MHLILEDNDAWLILSILYDPLILFLLLTSSPPKGRGLSALWINIINLISEVLPRHRNATLHRAKFRRKKIR
jgi:hypothetical protein